MEGVDKGGIDAAMIPLSLYGVVGPSDKASKVMPRATRSAVAIMIEGGGTPQAQLLTKNKNCEQQS